jgi:transposase
MDLDTGIPIFAAYGKGEAVLDPFFKKLYEQRNNIEAVSVDMAPAYINAVTKNLPNAIIVIDHFHVIKLINEKLDNYRRFLCSQNPKIKEALKNCRFLFLKNPENLNPEKNEIQRLHKALKVNNSLAKLYYFKVAISKIWTKKSLSAGKRTINFLINDALSSNIEPLISLGNTLYKHKERILTYFIYKISSGPIEGLNNKIKLLLRKSYGLKNKETLLLMVLGINEFVVKKNQCEVV